MVARKGLIVLAVLVGCAADSTEHVGGTTGALHLGCLHDPSSDVDGDCVVNVADNCWEVANPAQDDSNEDAEVLWGVSRVGDVCDEQPTDHVEVQTRYFSRGPLTIGYTVAPRLYSMIASATPGGVPPDYEARTGTLFCLCADATANTLDARNLCDDIGAGNCVRASPDVYDNVGLAGWERIETHYQDPAFTIPYSDSSYTDVPGADLYDSAPFSGETDPIYREVVMDYGPTGRLAYRGAVSTGWDSDHDASRWGIPKTGPFDEWTMNGVFLAHVWGTRTTPFRDDGDYTTANRRLTHSYWSGAVEFRAVEPDEPPSREEDWFPPSFLPNEGCPTCAASFPRGFFYFGECLQAPCPPPRVRFPDGWIDGTGFFASGAIDSIGLTDGRWIPVSEPDNWRGEGQSLQYAAVATDGTVVRNVVEYSAGLLRTVGVSGKAGPPARSDFGAVLSDEARHVFVTGGLNPKGAALDDLWAYDIDGGAWQSIAMNDSTVIDRVLAATYAPAEDALIVLDLYAGSKVRLLRVALDGSGATVLDSWSYTQSGYGFGLTTLTDGLGYAVSCSRYDGKHALLRFESDGGDLELSGYVASSGVLASPLPYASHIGLSVLLSDPDGRRIPTAYEHESFWDPDASTPKQCF